MAGQRHAGGRAAADAHATREEGQASQGLPRAWAGQPGLPRAGAGEPGHRALGHVGVVAPSRRERPGRWAAPAGEGRGSGVPHRAAGRSGSGAGAPGPPQAGREGEGARHGHGKRGPGPRKKRGARERREMGLTARGAREAQEGGGSERRVRWRRDEPRRGGRGEREAVLKG
jgi:hypothetical protein